MKFMPTIRPAEKRDADYLINIDVKGYEHAWLPEDWAIVWDNPDASIHVAVVYGTPVGFVVTEREEHHGELVNNIYKLAVAERFRRKGIGRKLLACAYDEAKKHGTKRLTLALPESMTYEGNPRYCLPWVQKMGFKADTVVQNEVSVYGQAEDTIIFIFEG